MNKAAIKNFAIQARNKLIEEVAYKAGLMGVTDAGIGTALPQSGGGTEYYDIGTKEPYAVSGEEIKQRKDLVSAIRAKQAGSDYRSAYGQVVEEVAYTWFNRLIAIRFMEVNDYLPSRIRVLSSVSGKNEPDIVTTPFEAHMEYTDAEKARIIGWKNDEKLDEAFRYLFLKQCNELSEVLPVLFEKVSDYTELLLTVSFTDKDGVVCHLVHDIPEEDFNVETGGQVEIIGWLYQYYNTEPKAKVFARASGTKIKKEEIPAATQLFTPDWIVRYMVENSLGRLWAEGHPDDKTDSGKAGGEGGSSCELKENWKYYLEEAEQEPEVQAQLAEIREEYAALNPEDLLCIDPCMGSGHILCYFFDVLMQIYESQGYTRRDAAQSILTHNVWGLDIDDRACQLAYFAVMMKARQYDRRILTRGIQPHVYAVAESNGFNEAQLKYFGATLDESSRSDALNQVNGLLEQLHDAKEYGSILSVDVMDWVLLREFAEHIAVSGQMEMDAIGVDDTREWLKRLIDVGEALAQKYQVTCTNPPYMGGSGMDAKLSAYVKKHYPDSKSDLFAVFIERCGEMTAENCCQAMITQHAWMFLSSFEKLRGKLLQKDTVNMAHLGARAFEEIGGEVVQTASFVLRKTHTSGYKGTYCRLIEPTTQQGKEKMFLAGENRYTAQQNDFSRIPGSPVAYWASEKISKIYLENKTLGQLADIRHGLSTGKNEWFVRTWNEVDWTKIDTSITRRDQIAHTSAKWFPYNKGGDFRKWYGNSDYVLWYDQKGQAKMASLSGHRHDGKERYFQEGITWSFISSSNFGVRYTPTGFAFDVGGSSMFFETNIVKYITGLLCSKLGIFFMSIQNPTLNFQVGNLKNVPVIIINKREVDEIVSSCIDLSKKDWDSFETSWNFQRHPLVEYRHGVLKAEMTSKRSDISYYIKAVYEAWEYQSQLRFDTLKANEEELNRIFIDIYGLQGELTPEVEDRDVTVRRADLQRDIRSLLSYAVGCMFGRYSLDVPGLAYAGGEWDDSKYSTFIPSADGVILLTDEEYFDDDIVGLFCTWLKKVYGADTLEKNLDFIARALGSKGNSSRDIIRSYFLNDFFKDHCSTYSVTGSGRRPIYWLYDSGRQNGFKALAYLHRYDADTTGRVRVNYLHRMEKVYEREIGRMEETIQNNRNNREIAVAAKRREKLQKQLKECREYDEKIAHLALARIGIDLDDGVKANYRKVQTDKNGKLYEILADSRNIMSKK